ncbi:MAG: chitobiase/beta-hexosaminidase C-terminal domain-containing protein [Planctomycetaceae bacterium]
MRFTDLQLVLIERLAVMLMLRMVGVCCVLLVGHLIRTSCAAEPLPPAFEPIIAASKARAEAAQKAVAEWKGKRDALVKQQKPIEKKIRDLGKKLNAERGEQLSAVNAELLKVETRLEAVESEIKSLSPSSFKTTKEFAAHDKLTDERRSLQESVERLQRASFSALCEVLRADADGAKLVAEWERLDVEAIGAGNEATLVQLRRDSIVRAEGSLQGLVSNPPKEPKGIESQSLIEAPQPDDVAARKARFAARRTPAGIKELGERFFSQMTLTTLGLEPVRQLVEQQNYAAALDAYKQFYFRKLLAEDAVVANSEAIASSDDEPLEGVVSHASSVFPPPTQELIDLALKGILAETVAVKGATKKFSVKLGEPGAVNWVFVSDEDGRVHKWSQNELGQVAQPHDPLLLQLCRNQNYPGATFATLLRSYAIGGPVEHLRRWADVLDDWTLNWQRDVEASALPIRDYNTLYVCRIEETRGRLKALCKMRASFVDDLPSDTFARWMMALNEEYLASSIRLGRSGIYNFRIMALNSMLPTSLKLQEFHAHQWALREGWRQVDNNFLYKTRQDGANHEFANDGHENTDQSMLRHVELLRTALNERKDLSLPIEPFWDREFVDNLTNNTRYWLHNLKQDGFSYRLNARSQRHRYIGFKPEYHLGLLAHEDELRRRAWQVHHVGKPEAAPTVFSESLAHQGYYYLRSGWGLDAEFLYFQSIGQPIMSGREDNTGFSLYGQRGIHLLSPAPVVDGKVQNAHFGVLTNPGGKTHFATYAWPNIVKTGRFHAGPQFDLCEGRFDGVYTYHKGDEFYDVFGSYGYDSSRAKAENRAMREGKPFVDEPIKDVRQSRRIISLRGRSTYIVTDTFESTHSHRFTQNFSVYTPVRSEQLDARVQALREDKLPQLISDAKTGLIATNNIGLPNLQLRHVSALPLSYAISDDRRVTSALEAKGDMKAVLKPFSKRDRHHTETTGAVQFSRNVAVNWEGQGPQVVVTIVSPQPPHYDATTEPPLALTDFKPLALSNEVAGFTAMLADGGDIEHLSAATARELKLGAIKAHASGLTVIAGKSGIALDCTSLTINNTTLKPTHPDFTFHLDGNRLVIDEPIYRPIQPVVIEPRDCNVFTDSMQVTLSCPTPGVEIRYSLDGSKPTPQSPLYTGPFEVRETSLLKTRAFRPGLEADVWQQDGTHATSITSAVLRKETLLPALALAATSTEPPALAAGTANANLAVNPKSPRLAPTAHKPGLKYEFFSGVWTEVMTRNLTMPAQATGTMTKLLDANEVRAVRNAQQPTVEQSAFGLRLSGYLNAPEDGVYTLHAPREFLFPDIDCGYDLRVFIDGHEWNPANRWHAHGNWSIALKKGPHNFRVAFADLRPKPHKTELMWGFPHPNFTWKGIAPQIEISGPGMKQQPLPANLLSHP